MDLFLPPRSREGQPPPRRASGLTLVEATFWAALSAAIGSPMVLAFLVSSRSIAEIDAVRRTYERARVILHRVERDVRIAIGSTARIEGQGKSLVLTLPLGFTDVAVRPGSVVRYDLALADGETSNGIDDNGNGLADEGELTRSDLSTGERASLGACIELASSGFADAGDAVVVTVATMGSLKDSDAVFIATRRKAINPRN